MPDNTTSPHLAPHLAPTAGATSKNDLAPGPLSYGGGEVVGATWAHHTTPSTPRPRGEVTGEHNNPHHHTTHPAVSLPSIDLTEQVR